MYIHIYIVLYIALLIKSWQARKVFSAHILPGVIAAVTDGVVTMYQAQCQVLHIFHMTLAFPGRCSCLSHARYLRKSRYGEVKALAPVPGICSQAVEIPAERRLLRRSPSPCSSPARWLLKMQET